MTPDPELLRELANRLERLNELDGDERRDEAQAIADLLASLALDLEQDASA